MTENKVVFNLTKNDKLFSEKIVNKNIDFLNQLEREKIMSEDLKEAMRANDLQSLLAQKKNKDSQGEPEMKSATMERYVSLRFGVVGSGQAGGRLAEVFYKNGYDVVAINTARQDLELLDIDEKFKYLVGENPIGGTGKDLEVSAELFSTYEEDIKEFLTSNFEEVDAFILTLSGSGGTGSGSAELLVSWLSEFGKPIIVIYVLPGVFDSVQGKFNAITTLENLSRMCSENIVNSLVLVDNAAIESKFPNLSQSAFFKTANESIVRPLHMFNSLSATPSNHESLDPMDFAKSLIENNGCCVFGSNTIPKEWYSKDETALVEAIMEGLDNGLLAGGFNLKEAQNVGVIITAKESVLAEFPYMNIAYVFKYISDEFKSANTFKGIYGVQSESDDIEVFFIFSGLGLPKDRVDALRKESDEHQKNLQEKRDNLQLNVSLNKNKSMADIDKKLAKIKKKHTGTSKLLNPSKPIRRR